MLHKLFRRVCHNSYILDSLFCNCSRRGGANSPYLAKTCSVDGLSQVLFESDSRTIVVAINDSRVYVNELGSLIEKCRDILFSQANFHFQLDFLWRQVNRVVHNLARAFVLESRPISFIPPHHALPLLFLMNELSLACLKNQKKGLGTKRSIHPSNGP